MKIFGIEHKESGVVTVDADRYELREGFFNFYDEGGNLISSYSAETVLHVVQQKQYSTEEVIAQIKDLEFYRIPVKHTPDTMMSRCISWLKNYARPLSNRL